MSQSKSAIITTGFLLWNQEVMNIFSDCGVDSGWQNYSDFQLFKKKCFKKVSSGKIENGHNNNDDKQTNTFCSF